MGFFDRFFKSGNKEEVILNPEDPRKKITYKASRKKIKNIQAVNTKKKAKVQAITEGSHEDLLGTGITGRTATTDNDMKKNKYKSYQSVVQDMYDMYNGVKDFGGEILKSVIRTRVSFIAGGGLTVIAENTKTEEWLTNFFDYNRMLEGSELFANVTVTELCGKCLLILKQDKKTDKVLVRNFYWVVNPYTIIPDEKDSQVIKQAVYSNDNKKSAGKEIEKIDRLVYIRTGGSPDKLNDTMPTVGNCLTDIENASRIKYDLRYNNHLYGRLTPYFKTQNKSEAKALNNTLEVLNWSIGKVYCGTAEFDIIGPPEGATEALTKEMIQTMKIVSLNTGIPIHWLGWPELMSNRATAENLSEVINAATIMEREIWEESLTELAIKAMALAFKMGHKGAINPEKAGDFEIKLPLISESKMKEIQETWIPLQEGGYITKDSVRNKIPGINPLYEKKAIEKETEERVDNIKNKFKNNFDHTHEEEMEEEIKEEEKND